MVKRVLITGASSGLGKAIAEQLRDIGEELVLVSRHIDTVSDEFPNGILISADITKDFDEIADKAGDIDVLINNAGVLYAGPFESMTDEQINNIFETNIIGHMKLTKRVYEKMKKKRGGHIINVISSLGLSGMEERVLYCATKFAMRGFSEALEREARPYNIVVTAVYPSGIKTNIFKKAGLPERDKYMDPKDVAKLIVDLIYAPKGTRPTMLVIRRTKY